MIDAMSAGRYPSVGWVDRIPLHDLVDDGIEALRAGQRMKVLVDLPAA